MELIKILQGLGSNDSNNRDEFMKDLKCYLNTVDHIKSKEEILERISIFVRIWNCIFYCKFTIFNPITIID